MEQDRSMIEAFVSIMEHESCSRILDVEQDSRSRCHAAAGARSFDLKPIRLWVRRLSCFTTERWHLFERD
jgi:hypothetical protein